jgi:hypothetical protein
MLITPKPYAKGRKSATRSRLRANEAAGVIGNPLSITVFSPNMRLPGVAAQLLSSKKTG